MPNKVDRINIKVPPFETQELREQLVAFLDQDFQTETGRISQKIGNYTWGVYAFFDYDGEPIYVGQTKEQIKTRIRRHLTNQRTDAVAMSVLDPFEVAEIEVWPLPEFEKTEKSNLDAIAKLNALEKAVYELAISRSQFNAVLNEKDPIASSLKITIPPSLRGSVVSEQVRKLRGHPDLRIARRALIISKLAQVISERDVQGGLRRVLYVQARRLAWLADQRYASLGGPAIVPTENDRES